MTTAIVAFAIPNGCSSMASNPEPDDGPTYASAAIPRQSKVIGGVTYSYVATPERESQIVEGYKRLHVGQNRREVRAILGPPDRAIFSGGKAFDRRQPSWSYEYDMRMLAGGANDGDVAVSIFFDPGGGMDQALPQNIKGLKDLGSPAGRNWQP